LNLQKVQVSVNLHINETPVGTRTGTNGKYETLKPSMSKTQTKKKFKNLIEIIKLLLAEAIQEVK
jgi:hypothetical protein